MDFTLELCLEAGGNGHNVTGFDRCVRYPLTNHVRISTFSRPHQPQRPQTTERRGEPNLPVESLLLTHGPVRASSPEQFMVRALLEDP